MIGWIFGIIVAVIVILIIIKRAKNNYTMIRDSGGNTSGVSGFLSACCGRSR